MVFPVADLSSCRTFLFRSLPELLLHIVQEHGDFVTCLITRFAIVLEHVMDVIGVVGKWLVVEGTYLIAWSRVKVRLNLRSSCTVKVVFYPAPRQFDVMELFKLVIRIDLAPFRSEYGMWTFKEIRMVVSVPVAQPLPEFFICLAIAEITNAALVRHMFTTSLHPKDENI